MHKEMQINVSIVDSKLVFSNDAGANTIGTMVTDHDFNTFTAEIRRLTHTDDFLFSIIRDHDTILEHGVIISYQTTIESIVVRALQVLPSCSTLCTPDLDIYFVVK